MQNVDDLPSEMNLRTPTIVGTQDVTNDERWKILLDLGPRFYAHGLKVSLPQACLAVEVVGAGVGQSIGCELLGQNIKTLPGRLRIVESVAHIFGLEIFAMLVGGFLYRWHGQRLGQRFQRMGFAQQRSGKRLYVT
jgi:hypothetical protein